MPATTSADERLVRGGILAGTVEVVKHGMEAEIDSLIARARDGDRAAGGDLAAAVYADFRRIARHFLRGERPDHTLQPTALANEAYLRLFGAPFPGIGSRAEFFAAAARTIRRILIEHARARGSGKRGGGRERVELDTGTGGPAAEPPARRRALAEVYRATGRAAEALEAKSG